MQVCILWCMEYRHHIFQHDIYTTQKHAQLHSNGYKKIITPSEKAARGLLLSRTSEQDIRHFKECFTISTNTLFIRLHCMPFCLHLHFKLLILLKSL